MERPGYKEPALLKYHRYWMVGIAILASLPYVESLFYGSLPYDDPRYLVSATYIGVPAFQAIIEALFVPQYHHYSPINSIVHLVVYWIGLGAGQELSYFVGHLINIVIHSLSAVLVLEVGRRLGLRNQVAILAALIFSWHPLHVEPVVWLTGRKDLLACFFLLLACFVVIGPEARRGKLKFIFSLTLFSLFSLLSKPTAVFLPAVIAILLLYKEGWSPRRILRILIPVSFLTILIFVINLRIKLISHDVIIGGNWNVLERCFFPVASLGHYVSCLFVPINLSAVYEPLRMSWTGFEAVVGFIALACVSILYLVMKKHGKLFSVRVCFMLFCVVIALLPVLNLIAHTQKRMVADSFAYMATPFFALALAEILSSIQKVARKAVVNVLFITILAVFCLLSLNQTTYWRNELELWQHSVEVQPGSIHARLSLANAYARRGRNEEALELLERSAQRFPGEASIVNNIAVVYQADGEWERAEQLMRGIFSVDAPEIVYNRGIIFLRHGEFERARQVFQRVVNSETVGRNARIALREVDRLEEEGDEMPLDAPIIYLLATSNPYSEYLR